MFIIGTLLLGVRNPGATQLSRHGVVSLMRRWTSSWLGPQSSSEDSFGAGISAPKVPQVINGRRLLFPPSAVGCRLDLWAFPEAPRDYVEFIKQGAHQAGAALLHQQPMEANPNLSR